VARLPSAAAAELGGPRRLQDRNQTLHRRQPVKEILCRCFGAMLNVSPRPVDDFGPPMIVLSWGNVGAGKFSSS
jgi:hypothetical protein